MPMVHQPKSCAYHYQEPSDIQHVTSLLQLQASVLEEEMSDNTDETVFHEGFVQSCWKQSHLCYLTLFSLSPAHALLVCSTANSSSCQAQTGSCGFLPPAHCPRTGSAQPTVPIPLPLGCHRPSDTEQAPAQHHQAGQTGGQWGNLTQPCGTF